MKVKLLNKLFLTNKIKNLKIQQLKVKTHYHLIQILQLLTAIKSQFKGLFQKKISL